MSVANVVGESIFHFSNSIPDVKFLDNLIDWIVTNVGEVTLKLNLSQLQSDPNTRNTMLAPASSLLWAHFYCYY